MVVRWVGAWGVHGYVLGSVCSSAVGPRDRLACPPRRDDGLYFCCPWTIILLCYSLLPPSLLLCYSPSPPSFLLFLLPSAHNFTVLFSFGPIIFTVLFSLGPLNFAIFVIPGPSLYCAILPSPPHFIRLFSLPQIGRAHALTTVTTSTIMPPPS